MLNALAGSLTKSIGADGDDGYAPTANLTAIDLLCLQLSGLAYQGMGNVYTIFLCV